MTTEIKHKEGPAFSEDFIDIYRKVLNKPFFSAGTVAGVIEGVSSKNLCTWAKKDLHIGSRDPKQGGWLRLSMNDLVQLEILTDLRQRGTSLDNIQSTLNNLSDSRVTVPVKKKSGAKTKMTMQEIEYGIMSTLRGNRVTLVIEGENCSHTALLADKEFIENYTNALNKMTPVLSMPFIKYVRNIVDKSKDSSLYDTKDSPAKVISDNRISEQEQKVLEILRNKNYEEVTLKRNKGGTIIIKGKTRAQGNFNETDIANAIKTSNYQEIRISVVDGKPITITREDSILI